MIISLTISLSDLLLYFYLQEVDIWSYGCLIFELLTLKIPNEGLSELELCNILQVIDFPLYFRIY